MTGKRQHVHRCYHHDCENTCACTCADPLWLGWECPDCADTERIEWLELQERTRIAAGRPLVPFDPTDPNPIFPETQR